MGKATDRLDELYQVVGISEPADRHHFICHWITKNTVRAIVDNAIDEECFFQVHDRGLLIKSTEALLAKELFRYPDSQQIIEFTNETKYGSKIYKAEIVGIRP